MVQKIIIDTDPGVDDTAAILLALASPELSVKALTTVYGNGKVDDCTRNALTILETAGRHDIPVFSGASKPLMRPANIGSSFHGANAFGGVEFAPPIREAESQHSAVAIIQLVMENPGEITLVALGPLTNVALALSLEPHLAESLKELIIMGGAVLTYGNKTPTASANLYNDPEAASIVYQSGAKLVQVGLDVCRKVFYYQQDLEKIANAGTPTTHMLSQITPHHANAGRHFAAPGEFPFGAMERYNDIPAITYCIKPTLFKIQSYYIQIATHDEMTRGQTVADIGEQFGQPTNTTVLMEVDSQAVGRLAIDRITRYQIPS